MRSYVQCSLRTKIDTHDWSLGKEFLESFCAPDSMILPEQISHCADRFVDPFVSVEACEGFWASKGTLRVNGALSEFHEDFAWRRKRAVKGSGYIRHTSRNVRSKILPGALNFRSSFNRLVGWRSLFEAWCAIFRPQLGMLHLFTPPELGLESRNSSFQIGSFNSALNPDVPDVGWAMFYGDEFAERIDAERISKSGFQIEKIGIGYLVCTTNSINDVADEFPLFSARRVVLKSLFPDHFFLEQ